MMLVEWLEYSYYDYLFRYSHPCFLQSCIRKLHAKAEPPKLENTMNVPLHLESVLAPLYLQ